MSGPSIFHYPPCVGELLVPERLAPLDAGTPNEAVRAKLAGLKPADVVGGKATDAAMAEACLAGLWLLHNFLDESHSLSQDIHTTTGSFWHAIMHRREGDYGNSKYWLNRVGDHPVFATLTATTAAELATIGKAWDPDRFVDLCRDASHGRRELEPTVRRLQAIEWRALFEYCFEQAGGMQSNKAATGGRG